MVNLAYTVLSYWDGENGTVELWWRITETLAYIMIFQTDENIHGVSLRFYKQNNNERTQLLALG